MEIYLIFAIIAFLIAFASSGSPILFIAAVIAVFVLIQWTSQD